jgi:hypothetical protein
LFQSETEEEAVENYTRLALLRYDFDAEVSPGLFEQRSFR